MELDVLYTHIASPSVVAGFPALARRIALRELPHGADVIIGIHTRVLRERQLLPPTPRFAPEPVFVTASPPPASPPALFAVPPPGADESVSLSPPQPFTEFAEVAAAPSETFGRSSNSSFDLPEPSSSRSSGFGMGSAHPASPPAEKSVSSGFQWNLPTDNPKLEDCPADTISEQDEVMFKSKKKGGLASRGKKKKI